MQRRLGMTGHIVALGTAGYFVVWGIRELIARAWPRLGPRRIARYRFRLPAEGRVFLIMISVLFIGSLLGRSNSLLLVFCCLTGPFVINGFLIFAMLQRLTVSRDAPQRMMAGDMPLFRRIARERHLAWTIVAPREPLATRLDAEPGWRRIYADGRAVIHVREPVEWGATVRARRGCRRPRSAGRD